MATPHILVSPQIGGPPHHSQDVAQDAIGFLAFPASFRLVRGQGLLHAGRKESRYRRRIGTL